MIFPPCTQPPASAQSTTPTSVSYTIHGEDEPYQPDMLRVIQRNFQSARSEVNDTLIDIDCLKSRGENWDGYGEAAPNPASIEHAKKWIRQMHGHTSGPLLPWAKPLVGADGAGNVVLEWWRGERQLSIFITPGTVEYLKSWGVHIFSEMEDGDIGNAAQCRALWNWLRQG